jgi:hypothetical protein
VLALFVALALVAPPQPIVSDRPDVTNGTFTVQPGGWQAEVGLDAEVVARRLGASPLSLETALRIGILPRAELRLLEGDVLEWITASRDRSGELLTGTTRRASTRAIDDAPLLEFGTKVRITEMNVRRWIPSFGIQPLLGFRPPGKAYRGLPVAGVVLIASQPMGKYIILDTNLGARIDGNVVPRRVVSAYLSGSLGVEVHPGVLLYAEVVGVIAARRDEIVLVDGGVLVHAHRRVVFDVSARVSPIGDRRTGGVSAGMTALLTDGQRWRRHLARTRPVRARWRARA